MTTQATNLKQKLSKIGDLWSPKIVAEMNDYQFKLAKEPKATPRPRLGSERSEQAPEEHMAVCR